MRVVYVPLYAEKEPFVDHKIAQQRTCFQGNLQDVYWIAGSPSNQVRFDEDRRILSLPIEESFANIFSKSIMAFQWLLKNEDFDFIVRTNTSTYFDVERMKELANGVDSSKNIAIGEFGYSSLNDKTLVNPGVFLAGTAIMLSRSAVELLVTCNQSEWAKWPDDVAISNILSSHGIEFEQSDRNDLTDYMPLKISTHYRVKSWSDEKVTSARFRKADEILHSRKMFRFFKVIKFHVVEFKRYSAEFPIHKGLNLLRWGRQISRYLRLDQKTWLWIFGADVYL